jgi:glycosyltransferase involved in cell wall biosynthesis
MNEMQCENLLTIAIPTYNRGKELRELLDCIFEIHINNIEVFVSDNGSTDETNSICEEFSNRHTNFNYFRHDRNQGYDLNVINCVKKSESVYIWFLSDDDMVNKEIIFDVISQLKKEDIDGILINSTVIDYYTNKIIFENLNNYNENTKIIVDDQALEEFGKWSTLLSSLVIKKSLIRIDLLKIYIGSCFVQLGLFWGSLRDRQIIILGKQKIIKRDGNKGAFDTSDSIIWLQQWINTIWSLRDRYSEKSCRISSGKLYSEKIWSMKSFFLHVLLAKKNDLISYNELQEILNKVKTTRSQKLLSVFIVSLPNTVIESMYNAVRFIYKRIR